MNKERINYSNKEVFIGIDVHRKSYNVCCLCNGELVQRCHMHAKPEMLVEFINKHFREANIHTAYESGFSGFVLHRYLVGAGIDNIVVHPASIEISARDKVKTDKRDSKKIAEQLAAGRLHSIRIPTEEEENRRLLTRTRGQLVRHRTSIKNQIRMKLHQFGFIDWEYDKRISLLLIAHILQKELSLELSVSLEALVSHWKQLDIQIRNFDKQLRVQATNDPLEEIYRSVPGIGPLNARILANELGDLSQFPNERALFSFTGLTPQEHSSGDTRRLGHISRQGSSRLRHLLVEAAWTAIRHDPALRFDFNRIALRSGKKRAIIAIARKLIGRIRAIFKTRSVYRLGHGMKKVA